MAFNRRHILFGGAGIIIPTLSNTIAFAEKFKIYPFKLGVASGDPLPDGFVIWTKLAPFPLEKNYGLPPLAFEVDWEVAKDEKFKTIVKKGKAMALPELGHSVHVEINGLDSGRHFFYRFLIDGHVSIVGRVKTAPRLNSNADLVKIGVAGCQNYEHGFYTAYKYMADEDFDAIFHYGDYIYETPQGRKSDIPVIREHIGPEPVDLDGYRLRYAQYKLDEDLIAAHSSCAFLMTYDDHEVDNNWAGEYDQDGTDPAAFLKRRYDAMRAWYENMPLRSGQLPNARGIQMYRRLDFGNLLRIQLLDTRQFRDDQVCEPKQIKACRDYSTLETGTILGSDQHAWVEEGLDNKFAWNLLAQQVVVMPFDNNKDTDPRPGVTSDSWSGYPASRRKLVESLKKKNIKNAIIATGDVHQNIVGYLPEKDDEPDKNQMAVEFVCTSISSLGDGKDIKVRGPDFRKIIARNSNVFFANGQRGYHKFTITKDAWQTDIMKIDKITTKGGKLSRLAGFTALPDSPLVIPS